MFLSKREVMEVFTPGRSRQYFRAVTRLASAVGLEALKILVEEKLPERSKEMGDYLIGQLHGLDSPLISDIRGRGLFVGNRDRPGARQCQGNL